MTPKLTDSIMHELQEVVDRKPGLSLEEISCRYDMFEQLAEDGAIAETDQIYLKMKMVGAYLLSLKGDFTECLRLLYQILALAHKLGQRDGERRTLNNIALVRESLGEMFEAIDIWEEILREDMSVADRVLYTNNLGAAYKKVMKPDKALEAYYSALELIETSGTSPITADIYNNLGNVNRENGNTQKALDFYYKALDIYKEFQDNPRIAMLYNNLCACYSLMRHLPDCEKYGLLALENYEKYMPEHSKSTVLNNMASLRHQQRRFDSARHLYEQSLEIAQKYNDKAMQGKILNNLALIEIEVEDYDAALSRAEEAQKIGHELNDLNSQQLSQSILKDAWQFKHDFTQAYLAQSVEMVLMRKINRENIPLDIARAEAGFLQRKLEKQLDIYRQQNLALEANNKTVSNKTRELETKNNLLMATNSLLNRIVSVIAHDVRGPVSSITQTLEMMNSGTMQTAPEQILQELLQSASHTRDLIAELLEIAVKYKSGLDEEPTEFDLVKALSSGLDLARDVAQTKGINIEFHSNVEELMVRIARERLRLIVRNLLSNAIKFSFPHSTIDMRLNVEGNNICLSIQDRGKGMSKEQIEQIMSGISISEEGTMQEKGFGMGLVFVLEAVLHTGAKLEITSEPGAGSCFKICYRKSDLMP